MAVEFIEIDLNKEEKKAVLELAGLFIFNQETKQDLSNQRKKWIRFAPSELTEIIGELSYYFNRSKSNQQFYMLDELISHLESYESRSA